MPKLAEGEEDQQGLSKAIGKLKQKLSKSAKLNVQLDKQESALKSTVDHKTTFLTSVFA